MPFSCFCIECVDTSTVGVLERFGNFQRPVQAVRLNLYLVYTSMPSSLGQLGTGTSPSYRCFLL